MITRCICYIFVGAALFGGAIYSGLRVLDPDASHPPGVAGLLQAPALTPSDPVLTKHSGQTRGDRSTTPPVAFSPAGASPADRSRKHAPDTQTSADPAAEKRDFGAPRPIAAGTDGAQSDAPAAGAAAASSLRPFAGNAPAKADAGSPRTPFYSSPSSFSLRKLGTGNRPTLLIIGGIQGDEPGGFSAAALLASHYSIGNGSVWVVPDLNFPSILKRSRGLFGDMNRKFAALDPKDPEYENVRRIQAVIMDENVDLVLNLHDGSGFYRPTWEDALRNPKRWGQSVIIDQDEIAVPEAAPDRNSGFRSLRALADKVSEDANAALLDPGHRYHIHNTLTAAGDVEMEKSLSWFAVRNGKPAFGVEASKEFTTEYRSYYHLRVVESFMRQMGIAFERDFELSPQGVLRALNSNLTVAAYGDKLVLALDDARPTLGNVPFKKGADPAVRTSKPLLALVPDARDLWRVAYGNRTLTRLRPEFMEFDDSLQQVEMLLDGKPYIVRIGEVVSVRGSFTVRMDGRYRVNAIGAQKERNGTEANIPLALRDFQPRFSVDTAATTYRVEIYKGKAFAGMVLVRFGEEHQPGPEPLTATKGEESSLGY